MKNSIHFVLGFSAFLFAACGGGAVESSEAASTTGGEHCDHCEHHSEHGEHAHCEHCEHAADGTHSASCACEHHGEGHGGEHGAMPAEVAALHEELAPVFHMEAGAARDAAACEHAASFRTHATTIAGTAAPEGADAAAWTSAAASLGTSADALVSDCAAGGANTAAQFDAFHTAFHEVMEAAGGHGEHGEHGEHHDEHHGH